MNFEIHANNKSKLFKCYVQQETGFRIQESPVAINIDFVGPVCYKQYLTNSSGEKMKNAIVFITVCLFACSFVFSQAISLVTLGDSLTEGAGDDGEGGGYPARLITMLQADFPGSTLNNLGISGDTSDDLVNKQLQPAVNYLNSAPSGNTKMALVWIGSNDLFGLYEWVCDNPPYNNNYPSCEDDTFEYYSVNLNTILTDLKATGAQVFIALLDDQSKRPVMADPVLRASSYSQISAEDVTRMSTQVTRYNAEITRLAAVHGASTVDFFNTTIFENAATLSDDGNHPNDNGYNAIAQIWYQALTNGSVPVPESNRWIHHVTSFTGGFTTRVIFFNKDSISSNVTLQPYSKAGVPGTSSSFSVNGNASVEMLSTSIFGNEEVSHFSIIADDSILVSVAYRVSAGQGASAHVNETTTTGKVFLVFPGEQDVIFDGLALVNLGTTACQVSLELLNSAGQALYSNVLDAALDPKEKLLATLDNLPMTNVASVRVTSTEKAGILFLRGTRPGVSPGYLYQVNPIILE